MLRWGVAFLGFFDAVWAEVVGADIGQSWENPLACFLALYVFLQLYVTDFEICHGEWQSPDNISKLLWNTSSFGGYQPKTVLSPFSSPSLSLSLLSMFVF